MLWLTGEKRAMEEDVSCEILAGALLSISREVVGTGEVLETSLNSIT